MNHESIDQETGEVIARRRHHVDALKEYKFLGTKREIFRRRLTGEQRQTAAAAATSFELQRDDAKARAAADAKWVERTLFSGDPESRLAREEEAENRKELHGAEAKRFDALRKQELRAAAHGYRWDEVETKEYADDFELEVFVVRMDTMEEVTRRRMNELEAKGAEERRQQRLFAEH